MKTKRFTAILLAALMLLTAAPLALSKGVAAESDAPREAEAQSNFEAAEPAEKGAGLSELAEAFNYGDTYIEYTNEAVRNWVAKVDDEGGSYLESGNAGIALSCPELHSQSFYMKAGETLQFQHWYETEANCDRFKFYVNDELRFDVSGSSNGWITHVFTAPADGQYRFIWEYAKDDSYNVGADCVRLRNCTYSLHRRECVELYATAPGCGMLYADAAAEFPFSVRYSNSQAHPNFIASETPYSFHQGRASEIKFSCWLPNEIAGTYKLEFDYAFSDAESADYFILRDDDTQIFRKQGNELANNTWNHYSLSITSGSLHTFTFEFNDKGSRISNLYLDNIKLVQSDDYTDRWDALDAISAHDTESRISFNTPKGSTGFDSYGVNGAVASNNYGLDGSTAYFEAYVNMGQGEKLEFDYLVSSELGCDYFNFYANGNRELVTSGWTQPQMRHYTFTAVSAKGYHFRWEYSKDVSLSRGMDRVIIANVKYTGTYNNSLTLDHVLNASGQDLHFTVDNDRYARGFIAYNLPTSYRNVAVSGNRFYENSISSFETTLRNVTPGSQISFDYYVSAESHEKLSFFVNGSMTFSPSSGDYGSGWKTYVHTLQATGTVNLKWSFEKDGSVNSGDDCAMIDNVAHTGSQLDLDSINSEYSDLTLHFTTGGSYPFEAGMGSNGQCYALSTNRGVDSSVSYMETSTHLPANTEIEFYYLLSSEENYDWLKFIVNGTEVHRDSGEPGIQIHRWVTPSAGNYTFRWEYSKDSGRSSGDDCVKIMEVKVRSASGGSGSGDIDGNGTVNVADAILALRHSMGIITLTSQQIARGDVNGDGAVTTADAITILRRAMGQI